MFCAGFLGYRTSIARYVAKWGIALICLCKKRHQRGVSHPVGGLLGWLRKYRAIGGIAAIVSQYSRDMGRLEQMWTIEDKYLKPSFESPHLDFSNSFCRGMSGREVPRR